MQLISNANVSLRRAWCVQCPANLALIPLALIGLSHSLFVFEQAHVRCVVVDNLVRVCRLAPRPFHRRVTDTVDISASAAGTAQTCRVSARGDTCPHALTAMIGESISVVAARCGHFIKAVSHTFHVMHAQTYVTVSPTLQPALRFGCRLVSAVCGGLSH